MNYYEHHIRDYDAATSHLNWDEDLAYTRLMRWYYRKERPIPADVAEACRQVRATTKAHRDAVASVLHEFFELREDGWHQQTCDEVIAAFQAGEPEREVKKGNEDLRMKRHRDERAALFKRLNAAGQHAPWNTKIEDLRRLVQQAEGGEPVTGTATPATQPATAPATPATATHTPVPNTQTPEVKKNPSGSVRASRLPTDWDPGESGRNYAASKGLTNGAVADELERFRDHWAAKPGKDGTKADWQAAWRTWVRNAIDFRRGKGGSAAPDMDGVH